MDLVLYYGGLLPSNGSTIQKHEIREKFHPQLKKLWESRPLSDRYKEAITLNRVPIPHKLGELTPGKLGYYDPSFFPYLLKEVNSFQFLPLVNTDLFGIAEIAVTLLRPEPAGSLIT